MNKRLIAMGVNQKLALANKKLQRMMPYMGVHHLKPLTVGSGSAVRRMNIKAQAQGSPRNPPHPTPPPLFFSMSSHRLLMQMPKTV